MEAMVAFFIAFVFSFIGTVPPGTLNLSILQLGLDHKISIAWRFALAAAIIEYPYAWLAVEFESLITSSPVITENFQLVAAGVMILLGILSLWSSRRPSALIQKFNDSGFRRGMLLALLNPMALPFWVAMTAYIRSRGWTDLSTNVELHSYLLGVSLGSLCLLIFLAYLARRVVSYFQGNTFLKIIPGCTLLLLGLYTLIDYII
jgi:threonine/homoserine/homoserine lactone efflux protein